MQSLRLIVYLNLNAKTDNKPVFEHLIYFSDGAKTDYSCLISSMRILFGSSCIVVLEIA